MAAGDQITTDYQYEYNGILFGADTNYDVLELSQFLGYPQARTSTVGAFGRHGAVRGRHYVPERIFTVEMQVIGSSDDGSFAEEMGLVGHAFRIRSNPRDELPFVYQHPGRPKRVIFCRPINVAIPVNRTFSLKIPKVTVQFECSDPRHYDLELKEETATLPTTGDGLDFPLDFPLDFGLGSSNSVDIINGGDAPSHWTGTVTGPATNPRIEASSQITDETLFLAFQNLTIVDGEELVLDSRDRSILLNGQNRRSALIPGSIWWSIPEFPDILTIHYTSSDDPITTSTFTTTWSDATWGN